MEFFKQFIYFTFYIRNLAVCLNWCTMQKTQKFEACGNSIPAKQVSEGARSKHITLSFGKIQVITWRKQSGLRAATLLKRRLQHRRFLVNLAKFSRILFILNTSGQLLLTESAKPVGLQMLLKCDFQKKLYKT